MSGTEVETRSPVAFDLRLAEERALLIEVIAAASAIIEVLD